MARLDDSSPAVQEEMQAQLGGFTELLQVCAAAVLQGETVAWKVQAQQGGFTELLQVCAVAVSHGGTSLGGSCTEDHLSHQVRPANNDSDFYPFPMKLTCNTCTHPTAQLPNCPSAVHDQ